MKERFKEVDMKVNIGDKVYIPTDKRPYTVKARAIKLWNRRKCK